MPAAAARNILATGFDMSLNICAAAKYSSNEQKLASVMSAAPLLYSWARHVITIERKIRLGSSVKGNTAVIYVRNISNGLQRLSGSEILCVF